MKVAIINGGSAYHRMFLDAGHQIVYSEEEADLICFTGGEDVNPELYGEGKHPYTNFNRKRDEQEIEIFNRINAMNKKMVGICRGAQFLHVMSGGSLWQDVDNHAVSKGHEAVDVYTGNIYHVTSTHHQMMREDAGTIVGLAANSTRKEMCTVDGEVVAEKGACGEHMDVEVVVHHNILCFQPHPELYGAEQTKAWFFDLIKQHLIEEN